MAKGRGNWPGWLVLALACGLLGCTSVVTPAPTYTPHPTYTPYPTYTPVAAPTQALWGREAPYQLISWQDAPRYLDQAATVEGTVVRTYNSGQVVFLDFHEDYQQHFKAVIFPDDWDKFPRPPEELFWGKLVRVSGKIQEYNGAPEIIINEPSQIEVALGSECSPCPPCATVQAVPPTPTAPPPTPVPPDTVVSWDEAAQYYGQTVTVEGTVVATYNSGKVVFLNFHQDYRQHFKVVIFPDDWDKFPAPPEELFRGKTLRVTGLVKEYKGAPEIIVEEPDQIETIDSE